MRKLDLGPVGVTLNVSADDSYLNEAVELETLGYSAIWLPGGQIDSLRRIAEIVRATRSVPVASSVISLDVYEPEEVAGLYAELQASAPDRFVVGLGGPQKPRPLRALNDYLDRLDAAEPPVPAWRRMLAALGPRKLELARDRFAGTVPLLVTPAYTRAARRVLGGQSALVIDQMVVMDTDPARARQTARRPLRFLSGITGYRANFARMGFTDQEISELSDRLVDELVTRGDADVISARINDHLEAGADQVIIHILNSDDQASPIEVARQIADRMLARPRG
jgi:probable F420-dependent oxidoreductase